MSPEDVARLEQSMYEEVREMLGSGYVRDYYVNVAGPFVAIAKAFVQEAERQSR